MIQIKNEYILQTSIILYTYMCVFYMLYKSMLVKFLSLNII